MSQVMKQPTPKPFWVVVALFILGAGGCHGSPPPSERIAPRVAVAVVQQRDEGRDLRLAGTIEAERTLNLGFALPGIVEAVVVAEGERVKQGQVLARLSSESPRNALGIAQSKAAQAEDAYRRLEPMHQSKTLPEVKWVEVETGRQQASYAVALARKNVDDTVLRAPAAGVVARRNVERGASVAPGTPAITLVTSGTVTAVVSVPESQIVQVRVGQAARATIGALGKTFDGKVREIGVVADPLTRTYPVKIALEGAGDDVRVGMVSEVRLRLDGDGGALAVPPAAIRIDEHGATRVYVVSNDEVVHRRPVTVVGFVGEYTAVTGELKPGERVVTSGTPMLADGVVVRSASPVTVGLQ